MQAWPNAIRTFGDPVLKTKAAAVTEIDGKVARLVDDMFDTLYESDNGLALAAPQIGVQKQIFVWDIDDEPMAIINPEIVESSGEWVVRRGLPVHPRSVRRDGPPERGARARLDLDGNEVEIEADELMGRMFQHEIDHLNGVLMFDRMEADQRKAALAEYRRLQARRRRPSRSAAACACAECASSSSARRRWPCRRCGRWSPPASTSSPSSPAPTSAAGGAARSCPAR